MRVVAAHHDACGADDPRAAARPVPARAVRRVRCSGCATRPSRPRSGDEVAPWSRERPSPPARPEAGPAEGARSAPSPAAGSAPEALRPDSRLRRDPSALKLAAEARSRRAAAGSCSASRSPRWLVIVGADRCCAAATTRRPSSQPISRPVPGRHRPAATSDHGRRRRQGSAAKPAKNTKLVRELLLLARPARGLAAHRPAGRRHLRRRRGRRRRRRDAVDRRGPEARLPHLHRPVAQASSQALAGSAQIVDRVAAPTPEATVVKLAADAPEGQPSYEVTLRVAGPYRYYLATSVQPDASAKAADGADLIAGLLHARRPSRERSRDPRQATDDRCSPLLALAAPLPAFAISISFTGGASSAGPATLSVSSSLESCGVLDTTASSATSTVRFNPLANADLLHRPRSPAPTAR